MVSPGNIPNSVEMVYLNDNNIRHKGAEELAKALETNKALQTLSLSDCKSLAALPDLAARSSPLSP